MDARCLCPVGDILALNMHSHIGFRRLREIAWKTHGPPIEHQHQVRPITNDLVIERLLRKRDAVNIERHLERRWLPGLQRLYRRLRPIKRVEQRRTCQRLL